jgi:hypothetical protein
VLDLPLSSSFTSLHDLFHSTAFVARNAANACRATAKRSDAALTAEARTIALVDDGKRKGAVSRALQVWVTR